MAAAIPMVIMAGAAISAMGAIAQGNAAKSAANYNAQINERDAVVALDQSRQDAYRVRLQGQQAQGSLLAGYGAAGVSTDEGSPLDVLRMSAANAKLDEETVRYKGRLKATGYYSEAALNRYSGETAQTQSRYRAASELLTGIGRAGVTYAAGQRGLTRTGSGFGAARSDESSLLNNWYGGGGFGAAQ